MVRRAIQLLTCFGLIILVGGSGLDTLAASAPSNTGTIEGRVKNAVTGAYLNNARIAVPGTTLQLAAPLVSLSRHGETADR